MNLKTKAWLASQGILVLTALLIQLTFYREIKMGPLLGTSKRPYWDIVLDRSPLIPDFVREKGLPPKFWDARLPLSAEEIRVAKLAGHRRAHRREEGLRLAFYGGCVVNFIYFLAYQLISLGIGRALDRSRS